MKRRGITPQARVIYRAAFNGETLPKRWRVYFVDRCEHVGWAWYDKPSRPVKVVTILYDRRGQIDRVAGRIDVVRPSRRQRFDWRDGWLHTLIHEFIHQRCPRLHHGREFNRLIDAALARVWET